MNAKGEAIAVWSQFDGVSYNIVASRFTPPPPPPCGNLWWIQGEHHWKWYGFGGLYIQYSADGSSWTTYATSAGSCGTPLVVDQISVNVVLYTDFVTGETLATFGDVAFNTSTVSKTDSGRFFLGGAEICGARGEHGATKSGVHWSAVSKSGCVN